MPTFQKSKEAGSIPNRDRFSYPSAAETVGPAKPYIYASTTSGGVAFTITLPSPQTMLGQEVTIYMVARNGTKNITVSGVGMSDIVLDLANEYTVLKSIGEYWVEIASNHA